MKAVAKSVCTRLLNLGRLRNQVDFQTDLKAVIGCEFARMRKGRAAWILLLALVLILQVLVPLAKAHGGAHDDDEEEDPNAEKPNLRAKSLILVKVWCLIIVFFATFIAGISPYYLRWDESFLVLGTQFAGGVFLATALIHFLADAHATFQAHTSKDYPFAFMLATAGFVLTLLADVIIQGVYSRDDAALQNNGKPDLENNESGREGATGSKLLRTRSSCQKLLGSRS